MASVQKKIARGSAGGRLEFEFVSAVQDVLALVSTRGANLCNTHDQMDSTKVMSLLEALDDEIDDLEESLEPLVKVALSETASKLPLLDKAKLYVLVTYAIESMLFCKSGRSR